MPIPVLGRFLAALLAYLTNCWRWFSAKIFKPPSVAAEDPAPEQHPTLPDTAFSGSSVHVQDGIDPSKSPMEVDTAVSSSSIPKDELGASTTPKSDIIAPTSPCDNPNLTKVDTMGILQTTLASNKDAPGSITEAPSESSADSAFGDQIHALLIGIDTYKDSDVRNLSGCVNDCEDVEAWLKKAFKYPVITLLKNEEATRKNIVQNIEEFAKRSNVEEGAPILIYFAGHGAEVKPPEAWLLPSERRIQMRIPYDFNPKPDPSSNDHSSDGGGILDRELSESLAKVSSVKGDNIVVILDSCHSASGTRGEEGDEPRGIDLDQAYVDSLKLQKEDFSSFGDTSNSSRASSTTPTNHILLAACREDESAMERFISQTKRGLFTHRLVEKLREDDSKLMTYSELILSLGQLSRQRSQHPHCDAIQKDRLLFSFDRKRQEFHSIDPSEQKDRCLQLGTPHGVQKDDTFLIFKEDNFVSGSYVGEARVVDFSGCKSVIQLPLQEKLPDRAFAVKAIHHPVIRITVPKDIKEQLDKLPWFSKLGVGLRVQDDRNQPQSSSDANEPEMLGLEHGKDWVKFTFLQKAHPLGETYMHTWPLDEKRLVRLFHQMGHFYHLLGQAPSLFPESVQDPSPSSVRVSIVLLEDLKPINGREHTLSPGNSVRVQADGEPRYGFKVTNISSKPIFFALFYFGLRQFNIEPMYNPPTVTTGSPTPCLVPNESKTIGYGGPGDEGFHYWLGYRDKDDFGYLKLFFSHQYLDLLHIRRLAIFYEEDELAVFGRGQGTGKHSRNFPQRDIEATSSPLTLGSLTFPIHQLPEGEMDDGRGTSTVLQIVGQGIKKGTRT